MQRLHALTEDSRALLLALLDVLDSVGALLVLALLRVTARTAEQ